MKNWATRGTLLSIREIIRTEYHTESPSWKYWWKNKRWGHGINIIQCKSVPKKDECSISNSKSIEQQTTKNPSLSSNFSEYFYLFRFNSAENSLPNGRYLAGWNWNLAQHLPPDFRALQYRFVWRFAAILNDVGDKYEDCRRLFWRCGKFREILIGNW